MAFRGHFYRYLLVLCILALFLCFIRSVYFQPKTGQKRSGLSPRRKTLEDLNEPHTEQDDEDLVDLVKSVYLREPVPRHVAYDLTSPVIKDFSKGQSKVIDDLFREKKNGFFVECGASNGETLSNSLFLERHRGWQGLLVDADPFGYRTLLRRKRKAYTMNACLGILPYPSKMEFVRCGSLGRLVAGERFKDWLRHNNMKDKRMETQCFPLYTMTKALNRTTVDFLSLSIAGDELPVLRTIPFHKLHIRSLAVAYSNVTPYGKQVLTEFLESKGYIQIAEIAVSDDLGVDILFAHNTYLLKYPYKAP